MGIRGSGGVKEKGREGEREGRRRGGVRERGKGAFTCVLCCRGVSESGFITGDPFIFLHKTCKVQEKHELNQVDTPNIMF